jgi:outer membrane protein
MWLDRRLAAALLVCLLTLPSTTVRGSTRMTLDECISKAFEENPEILDARERLAQARSGVYEARSGFLPNISLSGSYNFLEKNLTVGFPDPTTGQIREFDIDFTRDYSFQMSLSQPLYTGGRLSSSYRIAKQSRDISSADLESRKSEIAFRVIDAFYSLLLARDAVRVADEAIQTAEEFLHVVKARYETGEASSFEVMRAEVEVSNLRPALIRASNGVALSELGLKNAMGVDSGLDVEFVGTFDAGDITVSVDEAIESALKHRPEIAMMRMQKRIAEESLRLAKSGRLPSVAISANYDFLMDEPSLDTDDIERTYAGYLVLSLPLFDGFRTRSQIARAESGLRQSDISYTNLVNSIELDIRSTFLDIDAARETLRSQEENVSMAEEGLRIANERYVQGYATNLDVMDAQLALTRAKTNRIQATHDLSLAMVRATKAMGILLLDREGH